MKENGKTEDNGKIENGLDDGQASVGSDDSGDSISNFIPTPPDGGWGWVIVAASLMCNVIVDGIGYSFGIFLPEFVRYFNEPRSKVSLIGSLLCGTYLCAGPIVSALTNKFGCRAVAMTGSLISTIAFALATLSPNIECLIVVYGVIGGFGFGMIYLPSIVSVGYYFERKRAIATGIAVCGSGVGTFIFAPLTKFLLDEFDWKNALFILAGIVFQAAICGALMRPLEAPRKKKEKDIPREKNVIDRIKENAKKNRKRNYNVTSESSGIGPTDTTEILEKVRQAKLSREKCLQDIDSEICSLPSQYFEKDKHINRQDSRTSTLKSRIQKLSFSERGENAINKTDHSPVTTPITNAEGKELVPGSLPKESDLLDVQSEHSWSNVSSPLRSKSPDADKPESPTKLRMSESSTGSQRKPERVSFTNVGVHGYEIQPLIKVGNGGVQEHSQNAAKAMMARSSGAAGAGGSRHLLGSSMRSISSKDYSRPMYKKDIFYSGSIANINEFRSQPDMNSYITSITSIPGDLGMTDTRAETALHRACSCLPKSVVDVLSEMCDVSLLKNVGFMCICLGNIFAMVGFYVPYVYIVDRAMLAGIDKTEASFLLSVIGITNTIGRILSGVLADINGVNSLMLNNICMFVGAFSIFLTPFCNSYATLILVACVFGFSTAAFISLTSIVLCDLLGLGKLTNAFGLLSMGRGIAGIIGPPMAGAIFAATGNYDMSFYVGGALFFIGALLHFVLFLPCCKQPEEEYDIGVGDQELVSISPKGDPERPETVRI